jgi:glycosyltransferase involved in cell wall biosynthesis
MGEGRHIFAYVSRLIYPDPSAAAIQTIQMAAALARQTGKGHLFVHDLADSEERIREQYAIGESPLRISSLHAKRWPPGIYTNGKARFVVYNSAVATTLGLHPDWREASGRRTILFVRSRLESLYWGLLRPYLWWLRDWLFVCEMHDLDIPPRSDTPMFYGYSSSRAKRTVRALQNYDLVIALTAGLAEDVHNLTQGKVLPKVIPLCSGLQRLDRLPMVKLSPDQVVLGYIGTVDSSHGVDDLFEAIKLLPSPYRLRIIGPVRPDAEAYLQQRLKEPAISNTIEIVPPIHYSKIAGEIDDCDIMLAPAGNTVHSTRYRSPLKLFDYMARGKPVVAAGVPCHLELLQDGINARIYQPGNPEDLAASIMSLIEQPQQAESIACTVWEQSASYTYDVRARRILQLVDEIWERRRTEQPA